MKTQRRVSPSLIYTIFLLFLLAEHSLCSEIDFLYMPACALNSCLPFHASSIGFTRFTKSCFYKALAPINCARSNCTGADWYALEDWYSTQCPGEPAMATLDPGIPLGSRKCTREWIVPRQCKASITRNCFCRMENVTTGIRDCITAGTGTTSQQAAQLSQDFYRDTCVLKEDATGELRRGAAADEEVFAPPPSSQAAADDTKTEKLGLIVGIVASFITIVSVAWWFFLGCFCGVSSRPCWDVAIALTDGCDSERDEECCAGRCMVNRCRRTRASKPSAPDLSIDSRSALSSEDPTSVFVLVRKDHLAGVVMIL
jgi:hypothetical protein